jgi:hypothetical protein
MYKAIATHVEDRQGGSVKVIVVTFLFLNQQQWYLHSTSHQIHCCVATAEDVKDHKPLSVTSSHAKRIFDCLIRQLRALWLCRQYNKI